MDKFSIVLFVIWMLLAVAAFGCVFYMPYLMGRIILIAFSVMNFTIILSWLSATIREKIELNKQKKVK